MITFEQIQKRILINLLVILEEYQKESIIIQKNVDKS